MSPTTAICAEWPLKRCWLAIPAGAVSALCSTDLHCVPPAMPFLHRRHACLVFPAMRWISPGVCVWPSVPSLPLPPGTCAPSCQRPPASPCTWPRTQPRPRLMLQTCWRTERVPKAREVGGCCRQRPDLPRVPQLGDDTKELLGKEVLCSCMDCLAVGWAAWLLHVVHASVHAVAVAYLFRWPCVGQSAMQKLRWLSCLRVWLASLIGQCATHSGYVPGLPALRKIATCSNMCMV